MSAIFRPRIWFSLIVLFCAGLLGYALYVQHVEFLDPCPLCVLQRIAFIWIGVTAFLAAIHNPDRTGRRIYLAILCLGAAAGAFIAGWHIRLQNLPPGQIPDCGMSLNYMLESMPFREAMAKVFYGSGECAKVDWTLAGLSMPWWTLFCYIGIPLVTFLVMSRSRSE